MFRPEVRVVRRMLVVAAGLVGSCIPVLGAAAPGAPAAADKLPTVRYVLSSDTWRLPAAARRCCATSRSRFTAVTSSLPPGASVVGRRLLQARQVAAGLDAAGRQVVLGLRWAHRMGSGLARQGHDPQGGCYEVLSIARDARICTTTSTYSTTFAAWRWWTCSPSTAASAITSRESTTGAGLTSSTTWTRRTGSWWATHSTPPGAAATVRRPRRVLEDYRDFGGVRMAAKHHPSRDGDSLFYYVITSVTWDGVPDSTFTLPEAVRATLRGDREKG